MFMIIVLSCAAFARSKVYDKLTRTFGYLFRILRRKSEKKLTKLLLKPRYKLWFLPVFLMLCWSHFNSPGSFSHSNTSINFLFFYLVAGKPYARSFRAIHQCLRERLWSWGIILSHWLRTIICFVFLVLSSTHLLSSAPLSLLLVHFVLKSCWSGCVYEYILSLTWLLR